MLPLNWQADFAEALLANEDASHFLTLTENLNLYRDAYYRRFTQQLEAIYPLTIKLLGPDIFPGSAHEYIQLYPSRSPITDEYGEYFSYFLTTLTFSEPLEFLPELAQFEWAKHAVTLAGSHAGMNSDCIRQLTPDRYLHTKLQLHPACRLLHCHYPILTILEHCEQYDGVDIDIAAEETYLLMIRLGKTIQLVPILPLEYQFLRALQQGETIYNAYALIATTSEAFHLEDKLSQWIADKTIVDVCDDN